MSARLSAALAGLGFAGAAVLTVEVASAGPLAAGPLYVDRLGAVLLLLVLGVSAVVQGFARRYLHGDVRAGRFFAAATALTAATCVLVTAGTLVVLAVAWTLAGAALCAMLALYRGLPAADEGVRRTVRAFAIGDGALWLGVAVALGAWGNVPIRELGAQGGDAATLVACLLVVAALARSAQLPLGSWLPATLAAPTPVSALLHAGVVNAGGVLLVRTSPLFGASSTATALAFAAGAATAAYGTALMLVRPDVKGALAHSTTAQMGFMVMTCGLGAYAAAIFHLVAHGMYKATLFLGSGGAVRRRVRHLKAPPRGTRARAAQAAAAALVPAAAVAAAAALLYPDTGSVALLGFAWATAALAAWGWLQRHPTRVLAMAGALVPAAFAYVAALRGFSDFLAPSLAAAGEATVSAWALAPVAAGLALLAVAARAGLHDLLYVRVLAAAHGTPARPPGRRALRLPALPALPTGLVADAPGSR